MELLESGEMYLETMYLLSQEKEHVRAVDIVRKLGYSRPSVSRGVSVLKERGYITVGEHNYLSFTEKGRALVESIYEKHRVLTDYFKRIGVSEETAEADACRIEHVISDETFQKIKDHVK